ncbi:hypothetical protein [Phascolarctobacterium sp.]|uniref:hypothetical protein n=1 Tax=Phascolarctobacterium sp. TaxID=2049039 RepID=UPI0025F03FC0|nr:hypothetical protein [Phascolarctobacterium sp.]
MATWIIGLIIVGCVYLASKQVIKAHKTGGCIGCDAGDKGCCPHCKHTTNINLRKK